MSRSLRALESIQVERNKKIGSYNVRGTSDWSTYIDKVVTKQVEKQHKRLVSKKRRYHDKHPDFH